MKKIITLFLMMFAGLFIIQAQNYTWTTYYAPPASVTDGGNSIWEISGNTLIRFDKNSGFYTRVNIPDSIFICNQHQGGYSMPNGTYTQNGYPYLSGVSYDGQNWGTVPYQNPTYLTPPFTYNRLITDTFGNSYFFTDSLGMVIYNGSSYQVWDTLVTIMSNIGQNFPGWSYLSGPIFFDHNNNLWLTASANGLLKFDGQHFTYYDTIALSIQPSLSGASYINFGGIFQNPYNNLLYFPYNLDSVARYLTYDGTSWQHYAIPGISHANANPIFFGYTSTYFYTDHGLISYDGVNYSPVTLPIPQLPVNTAITFLTDYAGYYWLYQNGTIVLFDGTNFTPFTDSLAVLPRNYELTQLFDKNGNHWIGYDNTLGKVSATGVFQTLPAQTGTFGTMAFDTSGNLWHGYNGYNGVSYFDTIDHAAAGYISATITYGVAVDKTDQIFVVTDGGVGQVLADSLVAYPLPGITVSYGAYTCIAVDTANNKWFGVIPSSIGANPSPTGGLIKYDGTVCTVYDRTNSPLSDSIQCISVDSLGRIWVGTMDKGVMVYQDTTWTVYNTSNSGIAGNRIEQIVFKNGKTYIATQDNGFSIFDGTGWQSFTHRNSPLDNDCESIAVDDSCNIWIGQECGFARLSGVCGAGITGRVVHGHVYKPDHSPSVHEIVYLQHYDSAAAVMKTADYTYTDANGAYTFTTGLSTVYIHAVPSNDAPSGGIMPVYQDSSLVQQDAPPVHMDSVVLVHDLWSVAGQTQSGVIKLMGQVSDLQGKRVPGLRLFLMNAGIPVATVITGRDGSFEFTGLTIGSYKIYVDKMGIDNSLAPSVTFTTNNSTGIRCLLTATQLKIVSVGISDIAPPSITVYPNPTKGLLNISLQSAEPADMSITDMTGREILHSTTAPGSQQLDLSGFEGGIYILRIRIGEEVHMQRISLNK